jgi:aryl-alcohol dehydrogenase-like predicted oxidoreductase
VQQRKIGTLEVSLVGLGANNFGRVDVTTARRVIDTAIDCGVTLLDTADVYGRQQSEQFIGEALRGRREHVVLATKFAAPVDDDPAHRGASARWIREAIEHSLRRLRTDYIDLYQQHRFDDTVPLEETLGALDELVQAGKVREIGCSNFTSAQLAAADRVGRGQSARYVTAQNELNLVNRDALTNTLPACEQMGMGFLPYFPLVSGLLTGKYRRGAQPAANSRMATWGPDFAASVATDAAFDVVERVSAYAAKRGHTVLELAMAWLAAQPGVTSIIAGATKSEQVLANANAVAWNLTPVERDEVTAIAAGRS